MGDEIIWTLSSDRTKRRAVGRPDVFYDFVPPSTTTYGSLLELYGTSAAIPGAATYGRLLEMYATAKDIVPPPFPPMTRPTGAGIYAIEDVTPGWETMAGASGFIAAGNAVAGLAAAPDGTRTLTLPEHTFTAPSFAQSQNYLGFLVPRNIGVIGSGDRTIFEVAENGMTAAQSTSWERYGLAYGNVNLLYVFLTQQCPAGTTFAQFKIRGTRQYFKGADNVLRDHYFGGWNVQQSANLLYINDVTVTGCPGYLNTPPGETFSINLNNSSNVKLNRVEIDGRRESDGVRVAACLFGTNSASNIELRDCYFHHAYCSHGFGLWQTRNVQTWNLTSEYNGTGNFGTSGATAGDGLNHERSFNVTHNSPRLGNNSLCEMRIMMENKGDAWDGDTGPHYVNDLVITDGGTFPVRLDNGQRIQPILTRSPTPVYTLT